MLQPQRSDAEVQREAVDVPTKYFLDYCEGSISLKDFLGGIYFAAGVVIFVVGLEDTVDFGKKGCIVQQCVVLAGLVGGG